MRMIPFLLRIVILLLIWSINVKAEENYPDFNNPIEIEKIRGEAVLGTWTKLTNKTLIATGFNRGKRFDFL